MAHVYGFRLWLEPARVAVDPEALRHQVLRETVLDAFAPPLEEPEDEDRYAHWEDVEVER